jgi:uncharacterized protein YndB with AHSA1/START domain
MMMTLDTDLTLTVTRLIPASPERVFNAWLDPMKLVQFMVPGAEGGCRAAETDPRVGGRYSITMTMGDREVPHAGTYLEIDPHRRIAFTWEPAHAAPGSTVAIDLVPEGTGTMVTLTHVKFTSEDSRQGHIRGWTWIMDTLEKTRL